MSELFKKNKLIFIILILISLIVLIGVVVAWKNKDKQKSQLNKKKENVLPESIIIPTLDSSVVVDLVSPDKKEVILTIENIPAGTETIDYELSYFAKGNLQKGKIGTVEIKGDKKIERKITLGTCSSGSCVYDEGVENIEVSLKFAGRYGEKIFKKEFKI